MRSRTKAMLKLALLLALSLALMAPAVQANCTLNIHGNVPVMIKSDGTNRVVYAQEPGAISLESGDFVEAHCLDGIIFQNKLTSGHQNVDASGSKEIKCYKNNKIQYRNLNSSVFKDTNSNAVYVSCQEPWYKTLYESAKKLPNCGQYMNYAMGIAVPNVRDVISAGMCYDLDTLSLKFVNYLAYRPKYDHEIGLVNTSALRSNQLTVDLNTKLGNLNTYFTFMNQDSFNTTLSQKKSQESLLQPYEFDYVSLLQDTPLNDEFSAFSHIFNTMWWRNLRLGNWRFYLDALEERARTTKYVVYMGTSGVVKIPNKLPNNETIDTEDNNLSIVVGSLTVDAPEYIWSYIKSLHTNENEDFVVIGYNSPYYGLSSTSIFCRDMCDKIAWLKDSKFGLTRLIPTFGLTFCCRPEEVAHTFKNFPVK